MLSHRASFAPTRFLPLLALRAVLSSSPAARAAEKPPFVAGTFVSGGKKIRVERFDPKQEGKHPAVLFFHPTFAR